ncbi:MAG: DUF554 domain-containing protein [Clostridia bacterium]|nr:DUF554 domain-containing protein [Clostridia bacterium]
MEHWKLWGSIVNALAILGGAAIGLLLHRLLRVTQDGEATRAGGLSDTIMKGLGLCVFLIGVQGAIRAENMLLVILSIVIGAVIGHLCDLDGMINRLGQWIEKMTRGRFGNVAVGFVNASLLFCVGAMAVVGSLNSGLSGDHTVQYTKSLLDMISSVVFASSMGFGVLLSSLSVFVLQGSITLFAVWIEPILTERVIAEMSAVGSLLIIGLSLNMLGLTKIKVMNYLPAVFLPILLCLFM